MKKVVLFFALIVGLLTSASTLQAQTVNMSRYITLTVKKDSVIKLDFKSAADGTPVRIISGSNTQNITVGTSWYNGSTPSTYTVTADGSTTMTVYGNISSFKCSSNGANLTDINVSHNTELTYLSCSDNNLGGLDVSLNTQLTELRCYHNQLTSLDVSHNTQLVELDCSYNIFLSSLDVSHNTQLVGLDCSSNHIRSLDVSHNTQLVELDCSSNFLHSLDVSHNTQLRSLDCSSNILLRSLDVSHNTQLKKLVCYNNNFSAQALDDIYCALPDRTSVANGVIYPLHDSSSWNHAIVLATNKANAIAKNWKVQYYDDETDIPATTGTYVCGTLHHSSRYITLTVKNGEAIKLSFKAAAEGTPIRIVSGSNTRDTTVGTSWTGFSSYTAYGTTMTVYGDLTGFDCSQNDYDITAIDVSHNTQLTELRCFSNRLTALDVSGCTQLKMLNCRSNELTALDVSECTQLTELRCKNNTLTTLNVSGCTQLKELYCYNNQLSSLDVSNNTQLMELYCHGNNFSTQALDDIYCALPAKMSSDGAQIFPLHESSSTAEQNMVASTNAANARAKKWKVLEYKEDGDHTNIATTGSYVCGTPHADIADAAAEPALTLYPNPVADVLYLSATARTVRIYDMYGTEVAHATDTDRIDVASLPAGVYTVKADGTVAKMVKR